MTFQHRVVTHLGLEEFKFQGSKLHDNLTAAIEVLRSGGAYTTKAIIDAGIDVVIQQHTKLKCDLVIKEKLGHNGFVVLPSIDDNHVFFPTFVKGNGWLGDSGLTMLDVLDSPPKGSVNTQTFTVDGIFAKTQHQINIGLELMQDRKFTSGEISAIILHELGHLFTYYLELGSMVKTSLVLGVAAKSAMDIPQPEERVKVLKRAEKVLGIDIPEIERVANAPEAKRGLMVQSVLLSACRQKNQHETGHHVYEIRAVEQIADRAALYHGAGRDLVSGLEKIFKLSTHRATISTTMHVALELVKLILFIVGVWLIPIPMLVYLFTANPTLKRYDDPEARVRFIRQNLNVVLKEPNLPKEQRQQVLADIAAIELIEKTMDDKRTIMELFWTQIMPSGREGLRQEKSRKLIEDLMFNDLFASAARFKGA